MHPLFHPLFTQFITYFNEHEDYFECHEVLEEYWKEIAPRDKTHPLTAWILLATGMYHWRRGNFSGAKRSLTKSFDRIQLDGDSAFFEGIQFQPVIKHIQHAIEFVHQEQSFEAFQIQITSPELQDAIE